MEDTTATPPIILSRPARQIAPVVFTSPHSGRSYAPGFLAASRLDKIAIRRSEDSFVEELFAAAPALGAPLLAANFPRAWCDVNREKWELDPGMFADALPDYVNISSPRVSAGLGTIARIVGAGEMIYDGKLCFAEARERVSSAWEPFHAALRQLIDETVDLFGVCLVVDCHSMPSAAGGTRLKPDLILGDGHGTSCAAAVATFFHNELHRLGFNIRRNEPYAGGYITRHYGRRRVGVQAIQVELGRWLYMDEAGFVKSRNFPAVQRRIGRFVEALAAAAPILLEGGIAAAAE